MRHNPVLLQEVLEHLALSPGAVVMDGTLGSGGHSEAILEKIGPSGRLIGFDQDPEAIARCRALFGEDPRVMLVHENDRNLNKVFS
ncbi:MAG: 16S rRNA (cytosine(1402)-N(4))-methyltransferase, partial [Candidatus Omnitrophica bacterium]|nr:16S rRNA (cytosine(1402)-N(4))-methyltransferase [Candidatus Omnitrophota bacterium]